MKKFLTIVFCLSLIIAAGQAQAPNFLKYQAVVRTSTGQIIASQNVGFRISILQNSATGSSVYTESQVAQTNAFGLVNLEIGKGTVISGTFSTINWGNGTYYVKIELDATNSGSFADMGTTQLLSVPYSLYAAKAGNGLTITGTPQSGDILVSNGTNWTLLPKGYDGEVLKLDAGLPKWKTISVSGSAVPAANFTVSQLLAATTQTIQVDASGVADDVDPAAILQVRWRWIDGGVFTSWSTTKTASNLYTTEGAKNITLEVKDSQGNVGTSSRAININNSMFLPQVFTNAASDITTTGAKCGGNITTSGGIDVTARGVCWSTNQNPTTVDSKTTDGTGLGIYSSTLAALTPGTTYYVRAYATNSTGTSYGNQVIIQALLNVVFPTVTTAAVTNITANAVTSGGNVTATGGGIVTERGVCWSANQNPTISDSRTSDGSGTGSFQSQIAGLIPGTYYVRAYATNSSGTGYGNMVSFTTEKTLPVLTTKNVTDISAMGAVSGGVITSAGGGAISERGICWSDAPNPTITNEKTTSPSTTASFSAAIAKASPLTLYYLRAYAKNEIGTGYGDQKTFTTSDVAYYQSFETGMTPTGWGGLFYVSNESALDGTYSLRSLNDVDCEATYTITLSNAGQISFYYRFIGGSEFDFSIDDVIITTYPNNGSEWKQGLVPVTAGTHKFKWHMAAYGNQSRCFIDQIIITK